MSVLFVLALLAIEHFIFNKKNVFKKYCMPTYHTSPISVSAAARRERVPPPTSIQPQYKHSVRYLGRQAGPDRLRLQTVVIMQGRAARSNKRTQRHLGEIAREEHL